jgi:hypothetical protein
MSYRRADERAREAAMRHVGAFVRRTSDRFGVDHRDEAF